MSVVHDVSLALAVSTVVTLVVFYTPGLPTLWARCIPRDRGLWLCQWLLQALIFLVITWA